MNLSREIAVRLFKTEFIVYQTVLIGKLSNHIRYSITKPRANNFECKYSPMFYLLDILFMDTREKTLFCQ